MRKRILNHPHQDILPIDNGWLDLQHLSLVELTSEDARYPIEAALTPGYGSGWRAAQSGEQVIRFLFEEVQNIKRIQLLFHEDKSTRTQEFVLKWSSDGGQSYRDIVRQQYNFSPPDVTHELEDYTVDLVGLTVLELKIIPDISGGDAPASVAQFRIA